MPSNGETPVLAIRVPKDIVDRLDQAAADDDITRSHLIRRILTSYLAQQGKVKSRWQL